MKPSFLYLLIILFISCNTNDDLTEETPPAQLSEDLFFSEYLEGSSFNKALEIANLTGRDINLGNEGYTIRKQSNGAGNWMGEVQLSGTLKNQEVFVIANASSELAGINDAAHQLKTGAPMDFNGNDPIGLFKNGELLDVIGFHNEAVDFGTDVTLIRIQGITEPSVTFDPEEWIIHPEDYTEDLGSY